MIAKETPTPSETPSQQAPQGGALPREKRKAILHMWWNGMKELLSKGLMPRILISIQVQSHLEKKLQVQITYPGLSAKQAAPLVAMALDALAAKAKAEMEADGPRIIIPR